MADVARTVIVTPEQDQFLARVMAAQNWNRSQVVRLAIDTLRANPVLSLAGNMSETHSLKEQRA